MTSLHFIIIKLLAVKADAYPTVGEIAGAGYKLFVQRDKMVVEFLVLFHCLGPASSWFRPGLAGGISFCLFLLFACFFLFVAGVSNNNHNSSSTLLVGVVVLGVVLLLVFFLFTDAIIDIIVCSSGSSRWWWLQRLSLAATA